MADKETLKEMLAEIRDEIVNAGEEEVSDYDWYLNVLDKDEAPYDEIDDEAVLTIEDAYAVNAAKYPEFFPMLREIVEGITEINIEYMSEPMNVDGEWSAGSFFAARLALASKSAEDIALFAKHLGERDLDHEAEPYDGFGIGEIFAELGFNEATLPVVMGTLFANSQHRGNFLYSKGLTAWLKEGDNVNKFFKSLAEWAEEYRDISSIEDAFRIVLSDILKTDYEAAAGKFHEIRKTRTPVRADFE